MDISMCRNEECPSKSECYRFTATPEPLYQSYADFEPLEGEDKCEYFWDNTEYK